MDKNNISKDDYQRAIVSAYRAELIRRYGDDYIDTFEDLNDFPREKREELRQFFLTHLYPPIEERSLRDGAFESLGRVLRSPKKMLVLMKSALSSVWTLGRQFPAAVKAGFRTLETYLQSHRLEEKLIEAAIQSKTSIDPIQDRTFLAGLICSLPERDVILFRKNILRLFESLANASLLEGSLAAMKHSRIVMQSHPNLFSKEEISGIGMGIDMLAGGYRLFSSLDKKELQLILKGIDLIETHWYQEMRRIAEGHPQT